MKKVNSADARRLLKVCVAFLLATFAGNTYQVFAQEKDKQIEEIRRLYNHVNLQIAATEKEELAAPLFRNVLVINQNDHPWPAVGIYKSVIKFYYTFSNREGEPYPNKLLKITVETKRSDRSENAEYLFNTAGQLVFSFVKNDGEPPQELRYYFAGGRLIRLTGDKQNTQGSNASRAGATRDLLKEALRLKAIFKFTTDYE